MWPLTNLGPNGSPYQALSKVVLVVLAVVWVMAPTGTEALQCYNCRGNSFYDPNQCFNPEFGKTIIQECRKDEVCEKKLNKVGRQEDVIERGCSSNCDGRDFIWTDDFIVYCCGGNYCNSAWSIIHGGTRAASHVLGTLTALTAFWLCR